MSGAWRLRAGALTLIGTLAVHQGRYLAIPAEEDHHAQAHAYFQWLVPTLAALAFVVLAEFGGRLVRARRGSHGRLPSAWRLWLAAGAALIAIFFVQEALEGLATHGAWPTATELLAEGGWTALPLSVAVGGAIALLLRGAARVAEWAQGLITARPLRDGRPLVPDLPFVTPRGALLARRLAGRAPPLAR